MYNNYSWAHFTATISLSESTSFLLPHYLVTKTDELMLLSLSDLDIASLAILTLINIAYKLQTLYRNSVNFGANDSMLTLLL